MSTTSLAIGMIACPRAGHLVQHAVVELRQAEFQEQMHLFCEPGMSDLQPMLDAIIHHNPIRRGVLGNWAYCLRWLVEHTSADYLMVCEDDVAYCSGARNALENGIECLHPVGFWSLYTPVRDKNLMNGRFGWVKSNRGRDTWGTLAMCFPRKSAEIVLAYGPLHAEDQMRGPTDAIVAQCFVDAGMPCYYHCPSLANHLGRIDSVGHNWYDECVGLDFDPAYRPSIGNRSFARGRRNMTSVQDEIDLVGEQANVLASTDMTGSIMMPAPLAPQKTTPSSNLGKWDATFRNAAQPQPYGDTHSYEKAASFLAGLETIEDWGCGLCWFKRYLNPGVRYTGIDGSHSPWAEVVADLTCYTSRTEGILLRHVLEHNEDWRSILQNAVRSFIHRMVVVLFTPFVEATRVIGYNESIDVPDIAFSRSDLTAYLTGLAWSVEEGLLTKTQYGIEHIFYISSAPRR